MRTVQYKCTCPKAQGIMHVLLDTFPVRPEYSYLKMLRQLPQLYFRDPKGGNRETLTRYRQSGVERR